MNNNKNKAPPSQVDGRLQRKRECPRKKSRKAKKKKRPALEAGLATKKAHSRWDRIKRGFLKFLSKNAGVIVKLVVDLLL